MPTPKPVDQTIYDKITYLLGANKEGKPICPNIEKMARTTLFPNLDPFCLVGNISMIEEPVCKGDNCKVIHFLFAENPNYQATGDRSFRKNMALMDEVFDFTRHTERVSTMTIKGEKIEIKTKFDPGSMSNRFLAVVGKTAEGKPVTIETRMFSIPMPIEADPNVEIRKLMPLMADKKVLLPSEIEQFNDCVRPQFFIIPLKAKLPEQEKLSDKKPVLEEKTFLREETAQRGPLSPKPELQVPLL